MVEISGEPVMQGLWSQTLELVSGHQVLWPVLSLDGLIQSSPLPHPAPSKSY